MYNLTNITSANTLVDIVTATNSLVTGWFIGGFMFVSFFMFIAVFKKRDFKKVMLAGSFFEFVIGVMVVTLGWVGISFILIPIALLSASLLMSYFLD